MPNYRYNSQDYMRRRGFSRTQTETCSARSEAACPACGSTRNTYDELSDMPLAMAYVPWQEWKNIYEAEKGFKRGTIFEELDKPFCGTGGFKNVR